MQFLRGAIRWIFNARVFAILSLALFVFNLSYKYDFSLKSTAYPSYLTGEAFNATAPPNFDFTSDNTPHEFFKGKIFTLEKDYQDYIYGTFINTNEFTGTVKSDSFVVNADYIYIPITGYPAKTGNSLSLVLVNDNGQRIKQILFDGDNPGETLKFWRIDSREFAGNKAYLEMSDQTKEIGGWIGAGKPLMTSEFFETAAIENSIKSQSRRYNYAYYYLSAATIFALIFLPGIAIRRFREKSLCDNVAFIALPGFGLLAGYGFLLWVLQSSSRFSFGRNYLALMSVLALVVIFSRKKVREIKLSLPDRLTIFFYIALCLYGLQYLTIPVEVAQEIWSGGNKRSGMVASPPDHLISYYTAAYFFHKKNGVEMRKEYFGDDWSVASRGPLAAMSINAAFNIFRIAPSDPPILVELIFPADNEGIFLARIIGILTNGFVIFGAVYLALALEANKIGQLLFCLAWLTLSPMVLINTTFLWAKLLATYFIVLALCETLTRRNYKWAALWTAFAYYSHPVGGLFAPCLILYWAHLKANELEESGKSKLYSYIKNAFALSGTIFLWLLPWLIYKAILNHKDAFLIYVLGDGRGIVVAENFSSWLLCRWYNLLYTLVPTAFMFSDKMTSWLYGPLSEPLRWTIQYAKTLPAHLGFSLFLVAYWLFLKPNRSNTLFRIYILAGNFILMLVFWGFSDDGLGRNCLEPLSVILIIYAASQISKFTGLFKLGLILLLLEDFYLIFSGFFANPKFDINQITYVNWVQFFCVALTLLVVLSVTLIFSKKEITEKDIE